MIILGAFALVATGYFIRWIQEYRFWRRLRISRRRQAQVAVDVSRILNGVKEGDKPIISLSPLIRKYTEEKKMWRERLISVITKGYVKPYEPRHAEGRYAPAQLVQLQTQTIEMGAITEE